MENTRITPVNFIKLLKKRCVEDQISEYAYHITYSLLLSFFPFIIFLMTLIGYMDLDSSVVLTALENYFPQNVYLLVSEIITDVIDKQRDGLMSFSILFSVYAASGGFRAFVNASNRAMRVKEERHIILLYLQSFFWVVLFAFVILLSLAGIVFGEQILNLVYRYYKPYGNNKLLHIFRVIIPEIMIFVLFLCFYMFVPARKVCFKCAITGTVLTTSSWIIFTMLFQLYVNNYANYSRFYGTLGAVVALLLWLLLTSTIMLIGVEINALLMELKITSPD